VIDVKCHGQTATRVSVISWMTTEEDVDLSIETILRLARLQPGRLVNSSVTAGSL